MMQALQYIAQHDSELNFISMLPLSGYDGTRCATVAGCTKPVLMARCPPKPVRYRAYITWPDLSLPPAASVLPSYSIFQAMPYRRKIKSSVERHWFVSKAACTGIFIRITEGYDETADCGRR